MCAQRAREQNTATATDTDTATSRATATHTQLQLHDTHTHAHIDLQILWHLALSCLFVSHGKHLKQFSNIEQNPKEETSWKRTEELLKNFEDCCCCAHSANS